MEKIRIINENEYFSLDINDKIYQNMNEIQKDEYLNMYSLYMNFFIKYLIKIINLQEYDKLFSGSSPIFVPVKDKNMDIYQLVCSSLLKYVYIRNNLYLERLTADELKFLRTKLTNCDYSFNKEAFEFINTTFKKVIFELIDNDYNKIVQINRGPLSESFFAPNNSLVIGLRYDKFNLNNMSEEAWFENQCDQWEFVRSMIQKMEMNISSVLHIPCKVIEYDEFSIKPLEETKQK